MPTFTISIPLNLKKQIDVLPEVNWAEYVKNGFAKRLKQLQKFEEFVARGEI
jgi:hypothetical protein